MTRKRWPNASVVRASPAATQVEPRFDCVIWRSLRNAPPVEELLAQCIQVAANQEGQELPIGVDKRLTLLMRRLQQRRCLLVFDNFETVLHGERVGSYRPGYERYGQLLQRIGESRHQSCLLLTSREKPRELTTLASVTAPVRILSLVGLPPADCQALLIGWLSSSASKERSGDLGTYCRNYGAANRTNQDMLGAIFLIYWCI